MLLQFYISTITYFFVISEVKTCNDRLDAVQDQRVILSPEYPSSYAGNLKCSWVITAASNTIITIQVFVSFIHSLMYLFINKSKQAAFKYILVFYIIHVFCFCDPHERCRQPSYKKCIKWFWLLSEKLTIPKTTNKWLFLSTTPLWLLSVIMVYNEDLVLWRILNLE